MNGAAGNPLLRVKALGQSVWLDYIRRGMIESGELARLIREDGLAGVTSNPAIFEQAIVRHGDYEAAIASLARQGMSAKAIYECLALGDVGRAADLLQPAYEATAGRDGFVSLEVSPHLAHDTEHTVAEAQCLWAELRRPNVMIKVPGTYAGLPAIRRLIADGVNVNVTLLFGIERYRAVAETFLAGLEERAAQGQALDSIASVASFFLSRIDVLVDRRLDAHGDPAAQALRGEAAIACARLAYQEYKRILAGPRWQRLASRGARPQRLLWASTSTKDPAYRDVKYVEPLIGPDTVNTMTPETFAAYRDHGDPAPRLEEDLARTQALAARLAALGIDLTAVAEQLEREGVQKFVDPFDRLLAAPVGRTAKKRRPSRDPKNGF